MRWISLLLVAFLGLGFSDVCAEGDRIDTHFIEQPWRSERSHLTEVGRDEVLWRSALTKEAVFCGVKFEAPAPIDVVWSEMSKYSDLETMSPGVESVKVLVEEENYLELEIRIKVLWRHLVLNFQLEREPQHYTRFCLMNPELGEYRGVMATQPVDGNPRFTDVALSTWLKPAVPVSMRLLLVAERMVILGSVEKFNETCRELVPSG